VTTLRDLIEDAGGDMNLDVELVKLVIRDADGAPVTLYADDEAVETVAELLAALDARNDDDVSAAAAHLIRWVGRAAPDVLDVENAELGEPDDDNDWTRETDAERYAREARERGYASSDIDVTVHTPWTRQPGSPTRHREALGDS
jgi:hypothetical protein